MIQKIQDTVTEALERSLPTMPSVDLSVLENRLGELSKEIQQFKIGNFATPPSCKIPAHVEVQPPLNIKSSEKPYDLYKESFLTDEECGSMADFLGYIRDGGDLIEENGRSVVQYGEPYSYTGSQSPNERTDIPPELTAIIDKTAKSLALTEKPNSVLINYFPPYSSKEPTKSHLAMHSDDEDTITAESKIVTISFGASRKVVFEAKHDKTESPVELEVRSNSVYVMSRASQNWYKHGVPQPESEDTEHRFSITLRSLKKQFKRSVLLIGDSNSKEVNFGEGSGKVGKSYPGKRLKAAKVKDIDPQKCIGYSNIFIMCGTNDLRCDYIKGESDIHLIVAQLREKLVEIKQLCPKAKVFVIPVLPSRIQRMNSNITRYNELVDHMLFANFPDIWFEGIYSFVDIQGLLATRLTRQNDKIHLSPSGIAKLVTYIKVCVFKREKYDARISNQKSAQKVGSPEPT